MSFSIHEGPAYVRTFRFRRHVRREQMTTSRATSPEHGFVGQRFDSKQGRGPGIDGYVQAEKRVRSICQCGTNKDPGLRTYAFGSSCIRLYQARTKHVRHSHEDKDRRA